MILNYVSEHLYSWSSRVSDGKCNRHHEHAHGEWHDHDAYPGAVAECTGIHYAFLVRAICYLHILLYAVSGSKPNSRRHAQV